MDDVHGNLSDARENVRSWLASDAGGVAVNIPEISAAVHDAVERVLRVIDLPTRSDLETLNKNLERLAAALESFEARLSEGDE